MNDINSLSLNRWNCKYHIEIGRVAAVRAVAGGLGEVSPLYELIRYPLGGAAEQAEICGDGLDPPAGRSHLRPFRALSARCNGRYSLI